MSFSCLSSPLSDPGSLSQEQRAKEKNSIIVLQEEEEDDDESLLGGLAELVPRVMDHRTNDGEPSPARHDSRRGNQYYGSSSSSSSSQYEGDALSFTHKMPNMAPHRELLRRNILVDPIPSEYAGSEVDGDWDYDDIAAFAGSSHYTTTSNHSHSNHSHNSLVQTMARSSSPYSHDSCRLSAYHSQHSITDHDDEEEEEEEKDVPNNRGWSSRAVHLHSSSRDIVVGTADSTKSLHETKVDLDSSIYFQDMLLLHSSTTPSSLHDCDENIEVNYLSHHYPNNDNHNNGTKNAIRVEESSALAHTALLSEEEGGAIEIVATRSTIRNNNDGDNLHDHPTVHEPENVTNDPSGEEADAPPNKEHDPFSSNDTTTAKQYKGKATTRQDSFQSSEQKSSEKSNESESSSVMEDDSASTCMRKKMKQQERRALEKREGDESSLVAKEEEESYNEYYGENQYLQESSVASFTTMTGSANHFLESRNKTPISLPTFKPATGCTNASDFVVRCIAARLRGGVAVIKHGRSRWCRSRMRLLILHTDGRTLTWTPHPNNDGPYDHDNNSPNNEPNHKKRWRHPAAKKATPLDLATCSEVRHAWSPDPKCHNFTGTPILRSKCDAANAHKSFALVFPKRTVDITAVTADQCKVLMEGFSALIYRLQIAEMERTRLKLDEDHISTTLTGSSFTPSPIRTGSRRDM